MPTKLTKTTKKTDSSKKSEIEKKSKIVSKKKENKNASKKVVVKRRKSDLKPTKASAVAIVSQANRAKKQALIEKMAKSEMVQGKKDVSSNRIPLWVWVFFWCSLMLFCVSFYQAIIRPQIEKEEVVAEAVDWIDENVTSVEEITDAFDGNNDTTFVEEEKVENSQVVDGPKTAVDVINEFFSDLSNRDFDVAFDLMTPALRNYPDIKTHFTSFRMEPFLNWVEWWEIKPQNIKYINSPSYWKDVYNFDLSYVLKSNQEKYEEIWEFGVNTSWDEPKISSIRCISSKCSYHPIFWPENFGLTK